MKAHVECLSRIALDENGSDGELYSGEAGDALALAFSDLIAAGDTGFAVAAGDWPAVFAALISG